jgi:anti-sigma28 factor (negative regulator of flagellin synthesis)
MINDSFSITPLEQKEHDTLFSPRQQKRKASATFMHRSLTGLTRQIAIKRGILTSQRVMTSRSALITGIRARIEEGTYQIDSAAIAASLLENQTHFLEPEDNG